VTESPSGVDGPQTIRGLPRRAWRAAAKRAVHGFVRHAGIDSAAALTFYSALTVLPAALTVIAALSLGNGRRHAATVILDVIDELAQSSTVEAIRGPLTELFTVTNPGLALLIGITLSLWTMSGYATAFGRAVNRVYEVQEGRSIWKFRGRMLLLAVFLLAAFGAIVTLLVTTPRLAGAIAGSMDIAQPWIIVWSVGRWPVLIALIALVIAVLYYVTPNVRHERMRWVSVGAVFAIVAWGLAAAGFWFYVATVGQYDRIYGWLGGAIVLLLWLYLTNLVLVLGAEADAEGVRLRQLNAGLSTEEIVQLPLRDTARSDMLEKQRADDIAEASRIREDTRR
jgi:membrane protein